MFITKMYKFIQKCTEIIETNSDIKIYFTLRSSSKAMRENRALSIFQLGGA
jgi:hypothetical protein